MRYVIAVYSTQFTRGRQPSVGKRRKKSACGKPDLPPFYTSVYYYFWCLYFELKSKYGRVYSLCIFSTIRTLDYVIEAKRSTFFNTDLPTPSTLPRIIFHIKKRQIHVHFNNLICIPWVSVCRSKRVWRFPSPSMIDVYGVLIDGRFDRKLENTRTAILVGYLLICFQNPRSPFGSNRIHGHWEWGTHQYFYVLNWKNTFFTFFSSLYLRLQLFFFSV